MGMSEEELNEHIEELIKDVPKDAWKGAFYNSDGDILHALWVKTSYKGEFVNKADDLGLVVLRDQETNEVVGCDVWGLRSVLKEAGYELKKIATCDDDLAR